MYQILPVTATLGWVPQAAGQTLGVCIFSYNGTVRVGFRADAKVVTHSERLVDSFNKAIEDLTVVTARG